MVFLRKWLAHFYYMKIYRNYQISSTWKVLFGIGQSHLWMKGHLKLRFNSNYMFNIFLCIYRFLLKHILNPDTWIIWELSSLWLILNYGSFELWNMFGPFFFFEFRLTSLQENSRNRRNLSRGSNIVGSS